MRMRRVELIVPKVCYDSRYQPSKHCPFRGNMMCTIFNESLIESWDQDHKRLQYLPCASCARGHK